MSRRILPLISLLLVAGCALKPPTTRVLPLTVAKAGTGQGSVYSTKGHVFCGADCTSHTVTLVHGAAIELFARPSPGTRFVRWAEGCEGAIPVCTVHLDSATLVEAFFEVRDDLPTCGQGRALFARTPIDFDQIIAVSPIGHVGAPDHVFPVTRISLSVADSHAPGAKDIGPVFVRSPGPLAITGVFKQRRTDTQRRTIWDYEIHLAPCREMELILHHVQEVPADLQNLFGVPHWCAPGETICLWLNLNVRVATGQILGKTGLGPELQLSAFDLRATPLTYASIRRHYPEYLFLVCPTEYFTDTPVPTDPNRSHVRSTLEGRFWSRDGRARRTVPPFCGDLNPDRPGTAQGRWYARGEPPAEERWHLSLVHDHVNPSRPVISLGEAFRILPDFQRLPVGAWTFAPTTEWTGEALADYTNRDFWQVTAEARRVYCYHHLANHSGAPNDLANRVILLQMPDDRTLLMRRADARTCEEAAALGFWNTSVNPPPLSNAVTFER